MKSETHSCTWHETRGQCPPARILVADCVGLSHVHTGLPQRVHARNSRVRRRPSADCRRWRGGRIRWECDGGGS